MLTWNEIVNKYPDQWVALSNCEMDGPYVKRAIVEIGCLYEEMGKAMIMLNKAGKICRWERTKELEGGALCLME